ncbi:MAG: type II secretion system protein [Desulfurella sp.]|uniref:type II secretion system protein n=1 Tax=Desulfurella sp. TaxID=1962857 RepID=UPI003D13AED5
MKKGFTLIELAIVLVIIGLLIGVGVSLLPGLIAQQKYTQNQSLINQNYNTLIGYIMANGKLPMASSNTNGIASNQNIGYLPYTTIGGLQKDAYGNTFYYALNTRTLNISINGANPTSMNLANTSSIQNFCAVLYALNYYYAQNPTLSSSDVRTINAPNATPIMDAFVIISSGANNKLDSPNTITNSNGVFASQQYPLSNTYDDSVMALSITDAIGKFCTNYTYSGSCSGTTCTLTSSSQQQPPPQNQLTLTPPSGTTFQSGSGTVYVSGGSPPYTCTVTTNSEFCQARCNRNNRSVSLNNTGGVTCTANITFTDKNGLVGSGVYYY